ncbi:hypothetical protein TFLX_01167 [Thermoflexales bacterium]|nr:hypothetical protein TFLX_01167 [Thermoflexales bacterium]
MSSSYQLSGVKLVQPRDDLWTVQPATPGWFLPVLGGGVFIFLGIVFLSGGGGMLLVSLFFFVTAAYFLATYPLSVQVRFDFSTCELTFTASYLLRRSRHVEWSVPFREIASLGLRPRPFGKSHTAQIQLHDGAEVVMDFGRRVDEAERFVQRFAPTSSTTPSSFLTSNPLLAVPFTDATTAQAHVQRETQSWGTWLLIMGVVQMLTAQGLSPWGIVLIVVGAASFYFREAPMLIVYAVTVGWAGLGNLLYGTTTFWKGFALLQAWIVFRLFWQFRQFRRVEKEKTDSIPTSILPTTPTRTERWFPLITLLLGGVALLLFIAAIGGVFILRNHDLLPILGVFETLAVNLAVLGVATGLAGWLAIPTNKWVSIVGCLAGGLTLLAELALPVVLDALL